MSWKRCSTPAATKTTEPGRDVAHLVADRDPARPDITT